MKNLFKIIVIILFSLWVSNVFATVWYVTDSNGGTSDGTSWTNAFDGFSDISWGSISAGDTIYISGGGSGKTYSETLTIGASGSDSNTHITIKPGAAHPTLSSGHDGLITISSGAANGINYGSRDYVTVDGDDGGENRKIKVTNTTGNGVAANGCTGIKLLYIHLFKCGNDGSDNNIRFDDTDGGSEIGYCDVEQPYQDGIKVVGDSAPTQYGNTIVHHNWIHNMKDDGMSGNGSVDVYNNTIGPWGDDAWGGAGHADGMQIYAGYMRVYNNLFYDNNAHTYNTTGLVFMDHAFTEFGYTFNHIKIYNNVFVQASGAQEDEQHWGVFIYNENTTGAETMDDIVIVNNTFVDGGAPPIHIKSRSSSNIFSNMVIKNNIIYNGNYLDNVCADFIAFNEGSSSVDFDSNVIHAGNSGGDRISWLGTEYTVANFNSTFGKSNINVEPVFEDYTEGAGSSNDLQLASTDTACKDGGVDLSSLTNMGGDWPNDKNGTSRPQGSGWDIGAYEYESTGNISIPGDLTGTIN